MVESFNERDNERDIENLKKEISFFKDLVNLDTFSKSSKELQKFLFEGYKTKVNELLSHSPIKDDEAINAIDAILQSPIITTKDKVLFEAQKQKIEKRLKPEKSPPKSDPLITPYDFIDSSIKLNSIITTFRESVTELNSIRVNNISPMTIEDVIIHDNCLKKFHQDLSHGSALTNPFVSLTRLTMELYDVYNEKFINPNPSKDFDEIIAKHFKSIATLLSWLGINLTTSFLIENTQTKEIVTGFGFIFSFIINLFHLSYVKLGHQIQEQKLMELTAEFLKAKHEKFTDEMIMHYIQRTCYDKINAFSTFDKDTFLKLIDHLGDDAKSLLNGANEDNFKDIQLTQEQYEKLIKKISDTDLLKKFTEFEEILFDPAHEKRYELLKNLHDLIELHKQIKSRHEREVKYIWWSLYLDIVFFLSFATLTGFFGAIDLNAYSYLQNYFVLGGAILGTAIQILAAVLESWEKMEQEKDPNMIFALQISLLTNITSQFIFPALSIVTNLSILPALDFNVSNTLVLLALFFISQSIIQLLKTVSLYYEVKLTHQLKPEDKEQLDIIRSEYLKAKEEYWKLVDCKPVAPEELTAPTEEDMTENEELLQTQPDPEKIEAKKKELEKIQEKFIESYEHVYAKEISYRKIPKDIIKSLAMIELFVGITAAEYSPTFIFSESFTHTLGFNPTIYLAIFIFLSLHYTMCLKDTEAITKTDEDDALPHPTLA